MQNVTFFSLHDNEAVQVCMQVRQGLSHRQVLQQGIVQLQQQLAQELDMMVQQRMDAARHHFTHDIRCR